MEPLTQNQKEGVALLSLGTFLEYFDLMLYIHMAVLLNEIFFPKQDPHGAALLAGIAFCSTYLLRPVGAFAFGWLGDKIGRKSTVIITTIMMALSCIVMATLPTYEQIGITASWLVTICRIVQGMSSMGEITGSQLYLSETIERPYRYPAVALLAFAVAVGTMAALGIAFFVTAHEFNWRYAFWGGAAIAFIGGAARTKLRETPDFADAKRFLARAFDEPNFIKNPKYKIYIDKRADHKTSLSLFLMDCMWPICFYFSYVHCGLMLKTTFGYTSDQVIQQNFIVSLVQLVSCLAFVFISIRVHPLRILKYKFMVCAPLMVTYPYLLNNVSTPLQLFVIQGALIFFAPDAAPATSVFFRHFPIFKRFTYLGVLYALSRTLMYIVTATGFVYLVEWFGNIGILLIMGPMCIGYAYGWLHFNKLEIEKNAAPKPIFVDIDDKQDKEQVIDTSINSNNKLKENIKRKKILKRGKEKSRKIT